jgi:hypothetical protein
MERQTDRQKNRWTDRQTGRQTDGHTHIHMYWQAGNGQIEGQKNRGIERQMDK